MARARGVAGVEGVAGARRVFKLFVANWSQWYCNIFKNILVLLNDPFLRASIEHYTEHQ